KLRMPAPPEGRQRKARKRLISISYRLRQAAALARRETSAGPVSSNRLNHSQQRALFDKLFLHFTHVHLSRRDIAVAGNSSCNTSGMAGQPALGNLAHECMGGGVRRDVASSNDQPARL